MRGVRTLDAVAVMGQDRGSGRCGQEQEASEEPEDGPSCFTNQTLKAMLEHRRFQLRIWLANRTMHEQQYNSDT